MLCLSEEQFSEQRATRDNWVVGLISSYSELETNNEDVTELITISEDNVCSTRRRRKPVPCRDGFRLFVV
jgi:hypothetical protein